MQECMRGIRLSIHTQSTAYESVVDLSEVQGNSIHVSRGSVLPSRGLQGHCCRLKTQELKNIRRLAHEVLVQRSDVETFLVSSLKQVRSCMPAGQRLTPSLDTLLQLLQYSA